ncbi:F0F1 ATP synthase subunit A [Lactococcus hodotermopsidis]|uniref:ATP synthase subunit a n=1 Tax=Pseudolactococcus hodotermopsidis TaxID=2709157 RepID=A0A6A0B8H2_9LACT|nr:F0F1 ATP synthase subunit A [Lactococcus hodotermopsidis]GFH41689.1 F0F1 ATP synthase subunit A [Lactococcus hodotermopsidis]
MEKSWSFHIGPIYFDGTVLVMTVLSCAIIFAFVYWASRKMTLRPTGKQNALEWVIDFVNGVTKSNMGASDSRRYSLFFFVLFMFIFVANNIGLMSKIEGSNELSYWKSPTADIAVTLTLSLIVALVANLSGVKRFGFKGYLKHAFLKPMPAMLPMNIIDQFVNFMSLALRLYGNIFAGEVMIGLICQLGNVKPVLLPIAIIVEMAWTAFSLFIGSLQAYVFVLLSSMYINEKIEIEED